MQSSQISFKGQKIFVGIDVHKSTWDVTVITESGFSSHHPQKAGAVELIEFLNKHYPDGDYFAVYEAGFSGFSTYFSLQEVGIECIVIHAADVPTTQYEETMKTDKVDSMKLAKSLRAGLLRGIYIPDRDRIDDRAAIRIRKNIQRDLAAYKTRVKHLLHTNGISIPERFENKGCQWSKVFMNWLKNDITLLSESRNSIDLLIQQVTALKESLLAATKTLRLLSSTERYQRKFDILTSIPGIGTISAMTLLTEIYDVERFHNERQFASYLGLIPTCHSSGDKISHGEKTYRGNKHLGTILIEASWIAVHKDIGLSAAYSSYRKKMTPQEAIVRIARKLSNIIFSTLKTNTLYKKYEFSGC